MKILFLSSEIYPLVKTGGLADVASSLPLELIKQGYDIRLALPFYGTIKEQYPHCFEFKKTSYIYFGSNYYGGSIYQGYLPSTKIPLYLIDSQQFFNRRGLYNESGIDYPDNCIRFAFYCMQSLQMLKLIEFQPDIIHANDWHSALAVIYLKTILKDEKFFQGIKTLFTIHNISYQGIFSRDKLSDIGLDELYFTTDCLEFWNNINLMKGGIVTADAVNTVSPTYCKEIHTHQFGCGLEGVIQENTEKFHGILNGVDYSLWSPENDQYIETNYNDTSLEKKSINKKALQKELKLPVDTKIPLLGMITRIIEQKGFRLLIPALDALLSKEDVQVIILGDGEEEFVKELKKVRTAYPDKFKLVTGYKNRLSHLIEAGSDIYLMPSEFEPSGLNQMYSLKYGTIPIVRKVGGLNDTIVNYTPAAMKNKTANGFVLPEYTQEALLKTIKKAVKLYRDNKDTWEQLMKNAMSYDFSWKESSRAYIKLYKKILLDRK